MNMKRLFTLAFCSMTICNTYGQYSSKIARYFGDQIITDSSSTIIIPTLYNTALFSSNKMAIWGNYYANIIFYNFQTDSSKKLFANDTYIVGFNSNNSYTVNVSKSNKNLTAHYIFYRVKNVDHNKNGHIDDKDPSILYISDTHGNNLKALTTENENVVAIDIYEKQNFVLIKIQRDFDNNGDFEAEDKDFYFIKLNLTTLKFGNKIEAK